MMNDTTAPRRLKVGLLGLSDPAPCPGELIGALDFCDLEVSPILSVCVTARERADLWNAWMACGEFDWIFDVSGGNLSTLCLPFLDLEVYGRVKTRFAGYSDLTPVLNALTAVTGKDCLLFSARQNVPALVRFLKDKDASLLHPRWSDPAVLAGRRVLGGNIRCLLKLAGTPWMPDFSGAVLFLEANSGNAYAIASMLAQLANMGVLDQICALALGQFTELGDPLPVVRAVLSQMDVFPGLPVIHTPVVGHAAGSLALCIGKEYPA